MKKSYGIQVALVLITGLTMGAQNAWGWGREGHRAVGRVAELRLNDKAKAALEDLTDISLGTDQIASWADTIAHKQGLVNGTGPLALNNFWHYADIPYDADTYDQDREAQEVAKRAKKTVAEIGKNHNVIEQIKLWQIVLANPKEPIAQRKAALKFIVHFLGDIHQPLHCINRNDEGGNAVDVSYLGIVDRHVHLHQVWDDNLVLELRGNLDDDLFAFALNQKVTPEAAAQWEKVTNPTDWAAESHQLAKKFAYPPVIEQQ